MADARGLLGRKTAPVAAQLEAPVSRKLDAQFANRTLVGVENAIATALLMQPLELRRAAASRRRALSIEYDRVLTVGAFGDGGYDGECIVCVSECINAYR